MLLTEMTIEKSMPTDAAALPSGMPASEVRPPVYSSTELLQGRREAWIEHGQQMYRLRLTHAGKLYLTK
ncbi:MAG TPA: hemin uptake protein HemP [Pirellulales bacterium]|jgi:hemin uptake protein HemP|nr:hemin uptake protein HemP [Pirellulales bacterium]